MVLVAIKVRAYENRVVKDRGVELFMPRVPSSFLGRSFS